MDDLYEKEKQDEKRRRYENQDFVKQKILAIPNFSPALTFDEMLKLFESDRIFRRIHDLDKIIVFSDFIREAEK